MSRSVVVDTALTHKPSLTLTSSTSNVVAAHVSTTAAMSNTMLSTAHDDSTNKSHSIIPLDIDNQPITYELILRA